MWAHVVFSIPPVRTVDCTVKQRRTLCSDVQCTRLMCHAMCDCDPITVGNGQRALGARWQCIYMVLLLVNATPYILYYVHAFPLVPESYFM